MVIQDLYTTEAIVKLQPEKNSDLNGVRTYDLCIYRCSALPSELSCVHDCDEHL